MPYFIISTDHKNRYLRKFNLFKLPMKSYVLLVFAFILMNLVLDFI